MKFLLTTLFFLFLCGIFFFRITTSYRMPPSYNYDSDFGRDLLFMYRINHGKQILIGPQLSFAGLHLGPYPFYLFAPFLEIGNNNYESVLSANALFFLLGFISVFFFIGRKLGSKYTLLSLLWVSTTPYIILAARAPGNAFSYLIFMLWYLTILFSREKISYLESIIMGIFAGFIVNFHPISLIAVVLPFLAKTAARKELRIKKKFLSSILFFLSFALTFIPVFVFEVRHKFIIFQTVFDKSRYSEFFSENNHFGTISLSSIWAFHQTSRAWLPISIIGLFFILVVILRFSSPTKEVKLWFFVSFITALSLLLFGKWAPHYFFPVLALCQMTAIIIIKKFRYGLALMVFFILVNIVFFPKVFYTNARNLNDVESRFTQMLKMGNLPRQDINVVLINDTHLSAVGYEYRFLLEQNGFQVKDEFSYNNSLFLLLVSEKGEIDWAKKTSWELSEFGDKQLKEKYIIGNTVFYLFEKARFPHENIQ